MQFPDQDFLNDDNSCERNYMGHAQKSSQEIRQFLAIINN